MSMTAGERAERVHANVSGTIDGLTDTAIDHPQQTQALALVSIAQLLNDINLTLSYMLETKR